MAYKPNKVTPLLSREIGQTCKQIHKIFDVIKLKYHLISYEGPILVKFFFYLKKFTSRDSHHSLLPFFKEAIGGKTF